MCQHNITYKIAISPVAVIAKINAYSVIFNSVSKQTQNFAAIMSNLFIFNILLIASACE